MANILSSVEHTTTWATVPLHLEERRPAGCSMGLQMMCLLRILRSSQRKMVNFS